MENDRPPQGERRPVAYLNEKFLNSPDSRAIRILAEVLEPLAHFRREKVRDTVVFFGSARIRRGAKIDSLVQIGHACVVGEDNIICAQTGLAGSTVLERDVLLAGQVGSSGHLTVHEGAIVYAQSGIGGDVEKGARISGSPAFAASEWLRAITVYPKLPELLKTVRDLKKRVEELEKHGER